jgi:hypothetical protein
MAIATSRSNWRFNLGMGESAEPPAIATPALGGSAVAPRRANCNVISVRSGTHVYVGGSPGDFLSLFPARESPT